MQQDEEMRRIAAITAFALTIAACSGGDDDAGPTTTAVRTTATTAPATAQPTTAPTTEPPAETTAPPTTADLDGDYPSIDLAGQVTSGTEQLTVVGLEPGTWVYALGATYDLGEGLPDIGESPGAMVDANGAAIVRDLRSDVDWRLLVALESISQPFDVLGRDEHPTPSFYAEQRLPSEGLGYITTRDGTTLSASVWLPGSADGGPYPTVVEYSGYTPSNPESQGFPQLFNALGYAYVGVNIRGTGCSGGSFDYFEYTQSLDGYDAVETVAAQPWVLGNRVGMVGVSYPGISQLFVAQTQPPSLAAITPFSVIADTAISTLYPGGILNTGFAVEWAEGRAADAEPEGQGWAADRITAGDTVCADNQQLRLQNPGLTEQIFENQYWTDEIAAELAPRLFVDRITVPTFVSGAWQDEQTGGHFATMLDRFTGTDHFYATLLNGLHTDSLGPAVFDRFVEFLDLYVAERTPSLAAARVSAPLLGASIYGTSEIALPDDDRFAGLTYEQALAEFEAEPPIRVVFEHGAAEGFPARSPMGRFVAEFDAWPIPEATVAEWFLVGDGSLGNSPNAGESSTSYLALPDATPWTFYEGSSSGIWSVDVEYDWVEGGLGTYADWVTAPLDDTLVVAGTGSVDLYVQSNLGDTDLEVTITEVRPDGQEMYVQSGWLRASHRALDEAASTELRPVHTHRQEDAAPLPDGVFELVRVELFPFAHAFREGSRLRLIVDAPGGNRPVWEFATIAGGEQVTIAHDPLVSSRLVLPVVPDIDVPAGFPECGALRGQPCRAYLGD